MKRLGLSLLILTVLVLLTAPGMSHAAPPGPRPPSSSAKPLKLEHMDYFSARKLILGDGWKPSRGDCLGVDKTTCAKFPETASCSCCGTAPCGMYFFKPDQCLVVGTIGGPQTGSEPGDTVVTGVSVLKRPCPTHPAD